jgi:hypothetical protein
MWPAPRTEMLAFDSSNKSFIVQTCQVGEPLGVEGFEAAHLAVELPRLLVQHQLQAELGAELLVQHEVARHVRVSVVEQHPDVGLEDLLEEWRCVICKWENEDYLRKKVMILYHIASCSSRKCRHCKCPSGQGCRECAALCALLGTISVNWI